MDLSPIVPEMIARLFLATIFGGILGLERELRNKPAGLKTHMMVALGAATFSLVALDMYSQVAPVVTGAARVDPLRIVDGVISGIGFLGAGAIIQSRGTVRGLTTAGSLWLAGAIGLAVGGGLYVVSAVVVGIAVGILVIVAAIETRFSSEG